MTLSRTLSRTLVAGVAASALVMAGCSSDGSGGSGSAAGSSGSANSGGANSSAASDGITDADNPTEGPQRIVAATSDVAALLLQITEGERVVAVPATAKSDAAGASARYARGVQGTLPPGTHPEVEQVLSYEPDFVLATARHGGEKTFSEQLEATGVRTLVLEPDAFNTPEGIAKATREIGEAIGQPHKADQLASTFEKELAELDEQAKANDNAQSSDQKHSPSTLALMVRGPKTMVMDSGLMIPTLITRAGGTYAGDALGVHNTRPIDAEQLLTARPDILFLEDFQGGGRQAYARLLDNPAVADVPAIKNDRVYVIPMKDASAVSGLHTTAGYETIIKALAK
ncbi:ABC transporter substrate-binding protein [Corynebacterium sp. 320]|uniref:ABC transporter substrate-binding protein n=1 Tax=Corynebacterium TaxID=1716 RepID=UPI00125CC66C|nr:MULTISPECIES: ABC transporter substrate-binding protein [Corynebacterium]KAB1504290.1 ABC transporter substrate-binding protein [Corynebacterium sp. 320]KAB1552610.1 ABC transporter substrate-binding protein [Corynebacterium sp. 321]KAB1554172.1 ABC transporter substrate-binding protein [Corynebacterium sp. 319]KAB3528426.1 ABC transporter substrate-binding protein [Corynebacterium sp. 250]KAB3540084.1 ABC transporter substrate-binding protein [Corynebacterium sp. 366]